MKKENSQIRLKRIMEERGLRQVDILEKSKPFQNKLGIKMSKTHLSNYINGKSNPDQSKLVLLSKTLGVSEPWLMGYDVPRNNEEKSTLIEKTVKTMDQLEEPRQKIVLETANNQLKQQEKEKVTNSNIISLKNKASELTDEEFEKALDEAVKQTVAFDGKPLDEREQAIAKQMLREAWEEDNGKR